MLSEAKHLFAILIFISFVKGDRGATCEAPPLSPLTIPQTPSRLLNVCCTCICHSPQRLRQRYAYGSNIAAVRCGRDVQIKEQWRIKDSRIQSGAVLWLRHSFARAFSGDSVMLSEAKHLVIARGASLVAINRQRIPKHSETVDCFAYARNDPPPVPSAREGENGGWI